MSHKLFDNIGNKWKTMSDILSDSKPGIYTATIYCPQMVRTGDKFMHPQIGVSF